MYNAKAEDDRRVISMTISAEDLRSAAYAMIDDSGTAALIQLSWRKAGRGYMWGCRTVRNAIR